MFWVAGLFWLPLSLGLCVPYHPHSVPLTACTMAVNGRLVFWTISTKIFFVSETEERAGPTRLIKGGVFMAESPPVTVQVSLVWNTRVLFQLCHVGIAA